MVFHNYWQVVNEDSRVEVIYLAMDLWPNIPKSVGLLLLVYDNSPLFDLTYIHIINFVSMECLNMFQIKSRKLP